MNNVKKLGSYLGISILAFLASLNYIIFVFPNKFAPAGLDGICTMIMDLFDINMGYLSLMINIPLLIAVYLCLNHEYAIKSVVYIVSFSLSTILLNYVDLSQFVYYTETGTSIIFAPVAAGTIRGILYAFTLKLGGTSGGTDLIAALIKKKKPYLDLMNVIFTLNMVIALASYFVYGFKVEPVICSILYSFISSTTSHHVKLNSNTQIKYEVITPDYMNMCREILTKYNTTSTIMDARGVFSDTDNKVVICVADKKKAPYIEELINSFPHAVIFRSEVDNYVVGTGNIPAAGVGTAVGQN